MNNSSTPPDTISTNRKPNPPVAYGSGKICGERTDFDLWLVRLESRIDELATKDDLQTFKCEVQAYLDDVQTCLDRWLFRFLMLAVATFLGTCMFVLGIM